MSTGNGKSFHYLEADYNSPSLVSLVPRLLKCYRESGKVPYISHVAVIHEMHS